MKTIHIDGIGMDVSAVSLGLADIGVKMSVDDSYRLMDAFLDMGGNFLDTARVYSDWVPGETGRSERILGDWLTSTGKRNRVVIATKGAHPRLGSMHTPRMSATEILEDIELSLKALRVDTIDLYYLHRDDRARPAGAILETLETAVKAGKIARYACSNWQADRMLEAHTCAQDNSFSGFAANQVHWNMASAQFSGLADDTCVTYGGALRQAFERTGIVAVAWSSMAQGYFTKLEEGGEESVEGMHPYHTAGNLRVWRKAREIKERLGLSMTAVALNYLLCQPTPAAAVVGCRTMEQLKDVMAAARESLPAEAIEELETVMKE